METQIEKSWVVPTIFFIIIVISASLQSFFLPLIFHPVFIPYFIWPPLFYFFFYRKKEEALGLVCFASLFSSAFLSHSAPFLFFIYLFLWIICVLLKKILSFKSPIVFSVAVCIFSLLLPQFIHKQAFFLSFSFEKGLIFYSLKAITTGLLAFVLFPFLKRYFPMI